MLKWYKAEYNKSFDIWFEEDEDNSEAIFEIIRNS
jgi:hypothetical protein